MTSQNWLVTGGAGFIGANFVRWVLEHRPEVRVVVLDKLTYAGSLENLRDLPTPERFEFFQGDIASTADVRDCFEKHPPSAVLNFAAESHVDRSIDGPRAFIDTNIVGTFELLEAARNRFAELPEEERDAFRFLHISTDEVFGSLGPTGAFTESTPYDPRSPYSASKAASDHLVRAWHETYGLPVVLSNCSNNYGPFHFPEKLIPVVILNALHDRDIPVYGDGKNVRDWIHVRDHCRGLIAAADRGKAGAVYNFGGNAERTNLGVVRAVLSLLGKPTDLIESVTDRPGHDRRYAIDASLAEAELEWTPNVVSFEEGLADTVEWYLEHESWWRRVQSGEYWEYHQKQYGS